MTGRTAHRIRNSLLLVLGVAVGSAAFRYLAPAPHIRHVSPKIAHLESHANTYDVVFAGSSRVFRQILPKVFDRRLSEHNTNLRSFNFGIPAAKSVEVWHLLKRLEKQTQIRPRFVLIEPDGLLIQISKENAATEREVYWHGPAETALAINSVQDLRFSPRIRMSALHAKSFFLQSFAIGRLRSLGSQARESHIFPSRDAEDLGPDGDGWVPFVKSPGQAEFGRRQDFLDHLPRYRKMVARQSRPSDDENCLSAYQATMLTRLTTAIRALEAEPVFILSPVTNPRCEVHQASREGLLPNLFAFDDVAEYPELYEVRHRFDFEHLNTRGATIYSRLLADRFARYLNDHEGGGEE